ncbi:MAG: choice-of-anchor C family protein [Acidobacteria bacterium]|nr:choice-of-anchor C family protein [Acidobacteriota bacterium]
MHTMVALLTAAMVLAASLADGAPLLVNGSFEQGPPMGGLNDVDVLAGSTSIVGWTVFGQSVDYMGPPWAVSDAAHAVDLDGRNALFSGIRQAFATDVGEWYRLLFHLSGNPQGGAAIKRVLVSVGVITRDYQFDTSGQSVTNLLWAPVSLLFRAFEPTTTLSFMSLTGAPSSYGAAIDNVVVERAAPVPEPGALLLLVSGLAGLAAVRRRRVG